MDFILEFNYILIRLFYSSLGLGRPSEFLNLNLESFKMKTKFLSILALLALSFSVMAAGNYYGNNWNNNGNGNFAGDGNFGFSMNANARGNGNGWGSSNGNNWNNNGYNNGYSNGNGNGNFIGDGNFGFSMNANARGNGNGYTNNGYTNQPYYQNAPVLSQDQQAAQQKAQADYAKKMEEQRKAYFEAQKKAYDEYVAMMEKRFGKK